MEKKLSAVRFKLNPNSGKILEAMEKVKHFIIKKKLILVGGMAMDMSMRLKGHKIYDDDVIPDYDFYSSDNAGDAYQLGHELCKAGFVDVDVISAIHTTTMKVRVMGEVVADITYMPKKIFDTLRVHEYQGIQVIHPYYNMMDQFHSLSSPYENPPKEVIYGRWKKDVERMQILLQAYPMEKYKGVVPHHHVELPDLEHGILNGWAALAYHEHVAGVKGLKYSDKAVDIPVSYITVMSDKLSAWIQPDVKFYNYLFGYTRHIRTPTLEVYDVWGERITATSKVASLATILHYFFHTWLIRGDALSLYGIERGMQLVYQLKHWDVQPYGTQSWNIATLYGVANLVDRDRVKNWKPGNQQFDATCEITRSFDVSQSPLFAIDGAETTEFKDIVDCVQLVLA